MLLLLVTEDSDNVAGVVDEECKLLSTLHISVDISRERLLRELQSGAFETLSMRPMMRALQAQLEKRTT